MEITDTDLISAILVGCQNSLLRLEATVSSLAETLELEKKKKEDKKKTNTKRVLKQRKIFYKKKDSGTSINPEFLDELQTRGNNDEIVYHNYMLEHYPGLCDMPEPLSYDHYHILIARYGADKLQKVLDRMENNVRVRTRYVSVYLTANNWLKNER